MLLSIIIPTFNSSVTIAQTLESIANQTFKNVEVVLVDALSTDRTLEIVNGFTNRIHFNKISEKDAGIYEAMNKGIGIAKGEWIYFMGSDDVLFDDAVLKNVFASIAETDNIIYGDIVWLPSNKKEHGEWGYSKFLQQNINHQRIFYRASLFKKYGIFDTQYKVAADHELNIRFFCNPAIKTKYLPLDIAKYHAFGYSANKIDETFWQNWNTIVLKRFSPYLSQKEIYDSLGWYCWHKLQQKQYGKALQLFGLIFFKTGSIRFLKHTLSQVSKIVRN